MRKNAGFSVRIFLPTGEPEGLHIVEKSNWTGVGIVFPRVRFAEARQREELKRPGVYVLWGPGESGQLPRVYVGEGDTVLPRLEQHAKQKDFWMHAAVFTCKDTSLNKAHVKYLEARLVALAAEAKRAELDNGSIPQLPTLSEADQADAEAFLADPLLCLPVVGVSFFEKPKIGGEKRHELYLRAKGIEARAQETAEGFVVRASSQAVKREVPSIPRHLSELRRSLLKQGVLEDAGEVYRFTQDYILDSPSTAAGIILGRSANGRIEWKDRHGRTLRELQEEGVSGHE
ncbi:peptide methionine sulfoxide reductase [Thermus scotoductus]|uniref:Peptide methionine sulfoxide reductase n=1 Tax=Thermus scotoductus TaxID=37636 RepID=A0A430R9J9_THESC|nr:GIY-YIG nuclease family protein [Thermus scotoductus]RTH04038.1 peptide methionine sulfoxide reductase [Thermus scotoductus]